MSGSYSDIRSRMWSRVANRPGGTLQLLAGVRQLGKTTLLQSLAQENKPAIYAAGDNPSSTLPGSWDRVWSEAHQRAAGGSAILLLDEIQRWPDWWLRLSWRMDQVVRDRIPLHVIATLSAKSLLVSAVEKPKIDRYSEELQHWKTSDICSLFGVKAQFAVSETVRRGTYPAIVPLWSDEAKWSTHVREAIINPALGLDAAEMADIRKPNLLRQVFALAASSPCEVLSIQKIQRAIDDRGAMETVSAYLSLLKSIGLIAPIEIFSDRPRLRNAPPKLIVLNNALASAVAPGGAPDAINEPDRWSRWVENACLAFVISQGQQVRYWRDETLEVDAVIDGTWGQWAVEVRTTPFTDLDLRGLATFVKRYPDYRPLVITTAGNLDVARRAGFAAVKWGSFLMKGLDAVEA